MASMSETKDGRQVGCALYKFRSNRFVNVGPLEGNDQ